MANEKIVQVPLTEEYAGKLEADATKDDRTSARQGAFLIKAYYDGRLVWSLPGIGTVPASVEVPK